MTVLTVLGKKGDALLASSGRLLQVTLFRSIKMCRMTPVVLSPHVDNFLTGLSRGSEKPRGN